MQKLVDKSIKPADIAKALQSGSITIAQAQAMFNGVLPIGGYKGIAAILDLDKLVNEPLILVEKEYTEDILDSRNASAAVVIPIGTVDGVTVEGVVPAGIITVPAGEVWYCTAWGVVIPAHAAYTAGDLIFNFRVSSLPQIVAGTDKLYTSPEHLLAPTGWADVRDSIFVVAHSSV
ncbi:unnamed protein product, partial [marine sediment metagenome]